MKLGLYAVVLLVASISLGFGQVTIEMVLNQEQYLSDESMSVAVRVANRSGQPLQLGESGWLSFTVENSEGLLVNKKADFPPEIPFRLESSAHAIRRYDLMPYFDLSRPGRYRVSATLKIKDWDQEVVSAVKRFDIGRGTKLWEEEFGVPTKDGPPEVRKYILLQANYVTRPTVYLRLTDRSENIVYRVFPLAPLVSFSRPEQQIDRQSNLHVLCQIGAHSFKYCQITPDGELVARQTHYYLRSRPILRNQDGQMAVTGGIRQVSADDIPAPAAATSPNDTGAARP